MKLAVILLAALACGASTRPARADRPPNIILILCDNLGYGDVGCYGSAKHRTPNIDRMAAEGMRFTDLYSASGVCTPSRAALLTGCYPRRLGLHISDTGASVLQPVSSRGLNPDEITLAEALKTRGYSTAVIGKWHLGDQPPFLPTRQGFDEYLGIPYSDDMTPRPGKPWPPLPLMKDEQVIEAPVDRNLLTKRYTEAALDYLRQHRSRPFFLYLAHAMPGSTTSPFSSEAFRGHSQNGPWGDAVEEIDWSTGQILQALRELDLDDHTLVIWTNDNGAPLRNPPQGSNAPLSGWGYNTSEGAMRVPLIARWPGHVPPGSLCREPVSLIDLLPTIAHLTNTQNALAAHTIDGLDITPLLTGKPDAKSPHRALFYYFKGQLQAVRSGPWKLYLPRNSDAARLYNLRNDLSETHDLASQRPEIIHRLSSFADHARHDLGDANTPGSGQRPPGFFPNPTPRTLPPTQTQPS